MSELSLAPFRTGAEIFVAGSLNEGGRGVIREGANQLAVRFPPLSLAVLAVLIEKALRDESRDYDEWVPVGFLTAEQLFRALKEKQVAMDPKSVARAVFRLRELFRRMNPSHSVDDFGSRFIEFQEGFGYRVSTPASLLHLSLTDVTPTGDTG